MKKWKLVVCVTDDGKSDDGTTTYLTENEIVFVILPSDAPAGIRVKVLSVQEVGG